MNHKFKVGDRVDWNGMEGTVVSISLCDPYPIEVTFKNRIATSTFTENGRFDCIQTEPCLKLLPEKKKVALYRHWYFQEGCDSPGVVQGVTNTWDEFPTEFKQLKTFIKSTIVEEFEY